MFKKLVMASAIATLSWVVMSAQNDLRSVVAGSMKAMGVENVKTMVISGEGYGSIAGQPFNALSPWWRKLSLKDYVRSIDFEAKGWRIQDTLGEGENPPRGGAGRVTPQPTLKQEVVLKVGGGGSLMGGRGQGIDARAPEFTNEVEYAMLPLGFLKTALEKNATVKKETVKGKPYTVLTFPMENRAKEGGFKTTMSGWINEQGYVERVATLVNFNVIGDSLWDVTYTDWKDFGGVKFPTHIVQHQGDPLFFELTVSDVKANVPVDLTPPTGGRGGGGGEGGEEHEDHIVAEDLGDGFYLVPGGYAGVFAEFKDYVVAVEGPQSDERAEEIIKEIRRIAPKKPIRYVINTHNHFDHTGGLRAFVAEGATIITHESNKGYYEKVFAYPHTLVPDKLSKMKPQPKTKVEYMGEKRVLTDGTHTIEVYHVDGSLHSASMLMVYLPKQKALITADEFNAPAKPVTAVPARINSYEVNLVGLMERLKLDVTRIITIHPTADHRKVAVSELLLSAGKQ